MVRSKRVFQRVLWKELSGDLYQRPLVLIAAAIQTTVPKKGGSLTEKNPAG